MINQPKVSVIIPVYNAKEFIHQCMGSVINQTLKEIEIICVDDGSTDGSLEVLQEYASNDTRVKVMSQQNKFAGVARNKGMENATGKYFIFLDSDDFFELNLLEKLYEQASLMDADVCICGADRFDNNTSKYLSSPWFINVSKVKDTSVFSAQQIGDDIFNITTPVPWNKMFSSEFVKRENLMFQETQRANDAFFVWSALNIAERITYVEDVLVHYRINITTNLQSNNHVSPYDFIEALFAIKRKLIDRGIYLRVERGFVNHALGQCEFNLRKLIDKNTKVFQEVSAKIKEKYIYDFDIALHNSDYFYNHSLYENFYKLISDAIVPKISIIVPVYNVEKYIADCLESIVIQTYPDFEIICVNDGSTDNSMDIVNNYAEKDDRFIVIDKEQNEGLFKARKSGVEIAKGEYIIFIDSDDYIAPTLCEQIKSIVDNHNEDIIQFSIEVDDYSNNKDKANWLKRTLSVKNMLLNAEEILKYAYITRKIPTVLWGKIYKTAVCKKAYSETPDIHCFVGEDIFTFYYLAYFANSFRAVETEGLYFYRYGLGVGNTDQMSVQKFELYAKMGTLTSYIKSFLNNRNNSDIQIRAYNALVTRMLSDCCNIYKSRIHEDNKPDAAKVLIKYWKSIPDVDPVMVKNLGKTMDEFFTETIHIPVYEKIGTCNFMPKVSVIIPIYNVEKYLEECINSVLNQTLYEIEIICVNDGSYDNSLAIIEEFAAKDQRITVISRKNGGQSAARNIGLQYAQGEYLYFLDSDDYIVPETLETLYNKSKEKDLDILYFGAQSIFENRELQHNNYQYENYYERKELFDEPVAGDIMMDKLLSEKLFRCSVPLQFIKKDFREKSKVLFKEGIFHEDEIYSALLIIKAERVMCVKDQLYIRRIRDNSTMTSVVTSKKFDSLFVVFTTLLSYVIANDDLSELAKNSLLSQSKVFYNSSKRIYEKLSGEEKSKVMCFMPEEYKFLYVNFPYNRTNNIPINNNNVQKHFSQNKIINYLNDKIRGGIRCYRDNGLKYTIKHFFRKIWNRLKNFN